MAAASLVRTIREQSTAVHDTTLSERNVCISYDVGHNKGHGRRGRLAGLHGARWPQLQQLISLRHVGSPSTALSVLFGFSEYTLNMFELMAMRPSGTMLERSQLLKTCARAPSGLGIAIPFSFNNVYHATFHAAPSVEWMQYQQSRAQPQNSNIPHLDGAAVEAATFVPILHQRVNPASPSDAKRWFAWEFSVRALTSRSGASILSEAEELLANRCTCFDRLVGYAGAFNFNARTSRPRLRSFRAALLHHVDLLVNHAAQASSSASASSSSSSRAALSHATRSRTVLYVHRRGVTRALSNERSLYVALAAAVPSLRRVELDTMPLYDQMRTVAEAGALVAVFGQALTWMLLLPHGDPRDASHHAAGGGSMKNAGSASAVLEISPKEAFWKRDYEILAGVLGLRFKRIFGRISECVAARKETVEWKARLAEFNKFLRCNVTVDVEKVVKAARELRLGAA